jgi:hypothetical protein
MAKRKKGKKAVKATRKKVRDKEPQHINQQMIKIKP